MLNDMLVGSTAVLLQVQAQSDVEDNSAKVWGGWGSVIFVISIVAIVALVSSLLIWQLYRTKQTQMMTQASVAQSDAYRKLAEDATAAQNRAARELEHLSEGVTDLRARVASIERILAEVG